MLYRDNFKNPEEILLLEVEQMQHKISMLHIAVNQRLQDEYFESIPEAKKLLRKH